MKTYNTNQLLDQDAIAHDRLSPELRDADRRIYGVDRDDLAGTGPAVVSINGVVGSLAVTEFMVLVTGLRAPAAQLTYRADLGIVRQSTDQPAADCYYCSRLWGSAQSRVPADRSRVGKHRTRAPHRPGATTLQLMRIGALTPALAVPR